MPRTLLDWLVDRYPMAKRQTLRRMAAAGRVLVNDRPACKVNVPLEILEHVGPLSEGWRYQPDTAAYGAPYLAPGTAFPGPGHQATAALMKEKLDAASR